MCLGKMKEIFPHWVLNAEQEPGRPAHRGEVDVGMKWRLRVVVLGL